MFHIAVDRDQQRLINLVCVQPQFAYHFVAEVGFIGVVIVAVDLKSNFVFFE
jgi:hypothetical protein